MPEEARPRIAREVTYDSYVHLIRQLDELIAMFEQHPDHATRDQAIMLLGGIDMLHHEALGRLVSFLRNAGGGALLDRALEDDPIIRALLGLYGLAELHLPDEKPVQPVAFVPVERLTINGKPLHPQPERDDE